MLAALLVSVLAFNLNKSSTCQGLEAVIQFAAIQPSSYPAIQPGQCQRTQWQIINPRKMYLCIPSVFHSISLIWVVAGWFPRKAPKLFCLNLASSQTHWPLRCGNLKGKPFDLLFLVWNLHRVNFSVCYLKSLFSTNQLLTITWNFWQFFGKQGSRRPQGGEKWFKALQKLWTIFIIIIVIWKKHSVKGVILVTVSTGIFNNIFYNSFEDLIVPKYNDRLYVVIYNRNT